MVYSSRLMWITPFVNRLNSRLMSVAKRQNHSPNYNLKMHTNIASMQISGCSCTHYKPLYTECTCKPNGPRVKGGFCLKDFQEGKHETNKSSMQVSYVKVSHQICSFCQWIRQIFCIAHSLHCANWPSFKRPMSTFTNAIRSRLNSISVHQ